MIETKARESRLWYDLRLPGETSDAEALRRLGHLRAHALRLGACRVDPLLHLTGDEIAIRVDRRRPWSLPWVLRPCASSVAAAGNCSVAEEIEPIRVAIALFRMQPGRGCGATAFGVLRTRVPRHGSPDGPREDCWFWQYWCELQHVPGGDARVTRSHTIMTKMFEEARRIGTRPVASTVLGSRCTPSRRKWSSGCSSSGSEQWPRSAG